MQYIFVWVRVMPVRLMATLEILEGNGFKLHLKLLFEEQAILLARFEQDAIDRLARTIEQPTPKSEAGENPLELVEDGDGNKTISIKIAVGDELGEPLRVEAPVGDVRDLDHLYRTIKSPQLFVVRRQPLSHNG